MSHKSKRSLLFGFTAGAVSLILGSTAYACIAYRGDLKITGGSATSNLMTGANDGGMNFCTGRNPTTAAAGKANSTVTVDVDPATACNAALTNKLQDVSHDVRLRNGKFWTFNGTSWDRLANSGCWATSPPSGTLLGTFTPSGGSFLGNFTIPLTATANAVNEASMFCIGETLDDGNRGGMLAPFRVVV